jgi:hypothetical protein
MYKVIGSDGKEYGPVSLEDLRRWISEKRVDTKTMVQAEGDSAWKPLAGLPEFADLLGTPSAAAPPPIVPFVHDPVAFSAQVLGRPIAVDAMRCIQRSWELYKSQFSLIFPTTLVVMIASSASGAIPYFGFIISIVLNGVFYGGLYWFFLKVIRGEKTELTDAFAGFTRFFPQLMLGGAVTSFLSFFAMCIAGLPFLFTFIPTVISLSHTPHPDPEIILRAFGFFGVLSILFMIVVAFLIYAMWMFALPLIIDKGLEFWPAMELSRKLFFKSWRSLAILFLLAGIIGMSGVILCIVGVFLTMPIAVGAIAYAYEDIFGSVT